jgi:hypothetical protein
MESCFPEGTEEARTVGLKTAFYGLQSDKEQDTYPPLTKKALTTAVVRALYFIR